MYIEDLVFAGFSILLIISALMMIISRNTIYSALYLVVCFIASAALWILLEAEFLALILIFVYVGAVMTLFLFVVMLLNLEHIEREKHVFVKYLPLGAVIVVGMLAIMIFVISPEHFGRLNPAHQDASYSNIKELGMTLYTQYIYPLEGIAVLLLVAMVAAVSLSFRGKMNRRSQDIKQQLAATKSERLRVVKMDSEKKCVTT